MAKWRKSAHVVYQCSYYLVWTPKYRYRILQGEIKEYVENKIDLRMEAYRDNRNADNAQSCPHGSDNSAEAVNI